MIESKYTSPVPVLTVMVDFGMPPFLWRVENPDVDSLGANCCDAVCRCGNHPMSEALWRKFALWAGTFQAASFYTDDFTADCWDWLAFHARGLQLARELKAETGDAFHVVYYKPMEDPNYRIDARREVLADGSLLPLPPFFRPDCKPRYFCERIVSGGQTGADRAALDFAIEYGYPHGGWAPRGREAEDGRIPPKYQLTELPDGGYRQRTRRNVEDSDSTLIVNMGELDGGTLATKIFAEKAGKPYYVAQVDEGVTAHMAADVLAWLQAHAIKTLNVAGPRESKRPGIYWLTLDLLENLGTALRGA